MFKKIATLLIVQLISLHVFAASAVKAQHLWVRLISEKNAIEPGKTLTLGVHFVLDPEWHVYWQNPGDSGEPPRFQWALPQGFKAKPPLWPVPEKIVVGPLADYGYGKEVLFIFEVMTPKHIQTDAVTIKTQVKWLVCRQICIPGKADLDLALPTKKSPLYTTSKDFFFSTREKIPKLLSTDQRVEVKSEKADFILDLTGFKNLTRAEFFPVEPLQIDNPSKQIFKIVDDNHSELTIKKSEQLIREPKTMGGVLKGDDTSYYINAPVIVSSEGLPPSKNPIALMIVFAFLGGILLNLMPCVFPVLSMKVFSFLKMAGDERKKIKIHSLAYTLGILFSFWILVGALLILKGQGEKLGWGFQLQSPAFVATLSSILFLFGLSLVGVFEIGNSIMGMGSSLTRSEGLPGAFFTGVLATVVSTPCTAPLMGSAVGFALSQSAIVAFTIFTALALGLATPYVALSLSPPLGRLLPKPGRWMETLKQITAFLIFATVVWLVSVIAVQTAPTFIAVILSSFLIIALAAWILNRWPQSQRARGGAYILILLALVLTAIQNPMAGSSIHNASLSSSDALQWEAFSPAKVESYRNQGKNVFVDFTAAWCISCKVNELVVFNSPTVIKKLREKNVALLKADWTSHDPIISDTLQALGRSGVPTYALYEKNNTSNAVLLPEVITPGIVISALDLLK